MDAKEAIIYDEGCPLTVGELRKALLKLDMRCKKLRDSEVLTASGEPIYNLTYMNGSLYFDEMRSQTNGR